MKCLKCGKQTFVLFEGGICSACRVKPEGLPSGSQNAPEESQAPKTSRRPHGRSMRRKPAKIKPPAKWKIQLDRKMEADKNGISTGGWPYDGNLYSDHQTYKKKETI